MGGVVVRLAVDGDIDGVLRVERGAREAPRWEEARYREMLCAGAGEVLQRGLLVAVEGERVVGFAAVAIVLDEAELESVAVDGEMRRRGMGRALSEAAMAWARERGAKVFRLEVRAGNAAARGLYRGLGMAESGVRRGYYAEPVEDAVVMGMSLG